MIKHKTIKPTLKQMLSRHIHFSGKENTYVKKNISAYFNGKVCEIILELTDMAKSDH